jgi:signal transduction histidine kinase
MAGLAGAGQPAAGYAAAAGTVLVLLAAAAFAVTRTILRPLREAARLAADAGHGGDGQPGEVTARRSAADLAGHLEQACLQLRRPAAIVHGFTEYCRKHGRPPPAALDQTMQRVAGEITRMETLVDGLRMRSAGQSTGPDRWPDPPAIDPAAHARLPDTRQPPAGGDHAT